MSTATKLLMTVAIAGAASVVAPKVAHADECLEVGWKDKSGSWTYYKAFVDAQDDNHFQLHYDYHHGELEMKVFPKEKLDGHQVLVLKGRWHEGTDAQRSGTVRMELEPGHHRAKGYYTIGDAEGAPHWDFALRECK